MARMEVSAPSKSSPSGPVTKATPGGRSHERRRQAGDLATPQERSLPPWRVSSSVKKRPGGRRPRRRTRHAHGNRPPIIAADQRLLGGDSRCRHFRMLSIMHDAPAMSRLGLRLTPQGRLLLDTAEDAPILDGKIARRLAKAFAQGSGHGLLRLGAGEV